MTMIEERNRQPAQPNTDSPPTDDELQYLAQDVDALVENISAVVVAGGNTVQLTIIGLLSEGHLLLEDLPGVGKTLLAKTIARSIQCEFKRIQFTPDLMPSDVTGTSVFEMQSGRFDFIPGPIFSNIVLADEINRTGPRTQAALLEAMAESQVSVEGEMRPLPSPFMVIATQNLSESHGTFPLPDSQLDRFLIALNMGMPTREQETEILRRSQGGQLEAQPVISGERIKEMQAITRRVQVALPVRQYIVDVVSATRSADGVQFGVSPRGGAALQRASQTWAAINGRSYVVPEDVQAMSPNVLAHRLMMDAHTEHSSTGVIQTILSSTPIPA